MSGRCYDRRVPRRVSLPVSSDVWMTLARAREKLGGRVVSHGRAGELVGLDGVVGVILWSDETTADVWLGDNRTKRANVGSLALDVAHESPLEVVASDARAFAALEEGGRVVFDVTLAGRLIEKCRWGGLVARDDGRIFAVGFRRFSQRVTN